MPPRGTTAPSSKRPTRASSQIIRDLFAAIDETDQTAWMIGDRAGVHDVTLSYWKNGKSSPRLADFESVVQAMGYRLVLEKVTPPNHV